MGLVRAAVALVFVASLPGAPSWANPGDLDTSFGTGGTVVTSFGPGYDKAAAVTTDASGRIVVAGGTAAGTGNDVALARYTATGALDAGFGVGGKVVTPIGPADDFATAVVVDASNRIVVAALSSDGSFYDFAVLRYLDDGSLDPTFGSGGIVTTPIGSSEDMPAAIAIDASNRIVVAGRAWTLSNHDFAVVRYTDSGALDPTFGSGGIVTTAVGAGFDVGLAMALDASNRIVVAGYSGADFAVVRYEFDGTLDPTFNGGAPVTTSIQGNSDTAHGVAVDSDGRIVVAGASLNPASTAYDFAVARYTEAGALDPLFGTGGTVVTPIGATSIGGLGLGVRLDTSGRIVVGGSVYGGTDEDFGVVRYMPSGSLDPSFGSGGIVLTPVGPLNDWGQALTIDGGGRIVVAGYSTDATDSTSDFAVVRYVGGSVGTCGDGLLDPGESCDVGSQNGQPTACCTATCNFVAAFTQCRASTSLCDVAEFCTGINGPCPVDLPVPDGTSCARDADPCTTDRCSSGTCAHTPVSGCNPGGSTEASVGGPGNDCTGGTPVPGGCEVSAGGVTLTIPDGALATTTNINVVDTAPASCASYLSIQDNNGQLATCTQLLPSGLQLAQPARLELGWSGCPDGCDVDWPGGCDDPLPEGTTRVFLDGVPVADRCDASDVCPGAALPGDIAHSCDDSALCAEAICNPTANTWTLVALAHFSEFAIGTETCADVVAPIRLHLSHVGEAGKGTVAFTGQLPGSAAALLDPVANGLRFVVSDGGTAVVNALLPAGAYDATAGVGWKVAGNGLKWTWADESASPPDGVYKLGMKTKLIAPGQYKPVKIKAKAKGRTLATPAAVGAEVRLPDSGSCFGIRPGSLSCSPRGTGVDCRG
jgi:uncharacterized delta-60 repeat protein